MSIALKTFNPTDRDVVQLQENTREAIEQLSVQQTPSVGVVSVTANTKLVGNEDVVLVDSSAATGPIALILPGPRLLLTVLIVHVTRAGGNAVQVKAVDIPSTGTPTINGAALVSIPPGTAGSLRIVSDGRNYWTV